MFGFLREWRVTREVRRRGWAFVHDDAASAGPPFSYSVGLWETKGRPELAVAGLKAATARGVIAEAIRQSDAGGLVLVDMARWSGVIAGHDCVWRRVDPSQLTPDRFGAALWYRRHRTGRFDEVEAFQLVWPDMEGRFPWEPGCAIDARFGQWPFWAPRESDPTAWWKAIAAEAEAGLRPYGGL